MRVTRKKDRHEQNKTKSGNYLTAVRDVYGFTSVPYSIIFAVAGSFLFGSAFAVSQVCFGSFFKDKISTLIKILGGSSCKT